MRDDETGAVTALWHRCGLVVPWNDPSADLTLARSVANAEILVLRLDGAVAASVMVGHDGHRGWVYYLSVDPDRRGRGLGRALMAAAEVWLANRHLPKMQLMIRPDNHAVRDFYVALGFTEKPRLVMDKWFDGRTSR